MPGIGFLPGGEPIEKRGLLRRHDAILLAAGDGQPDLLLWPQALFRLLPPALDHLRGLFVLLGHLREAALA